MINALPRRLRRPVDLAVIVGLVVACAFVLRNQDVSAVAGRASVLDGDSLRIAGHEVRLHAIDAPEGRQTCLDANAQSYRCGRQAARHLSRLVRNSEVTCAVVETDRYDRAVAVCEAGGRDINEAMVESGWAVAYLRHSVRYASAEARAREARRGLWAGRFDRPESWRAANRAGMAADAAGSKPAPPD